MNAEEILQQVYDWITDPATFLNDEKNCRKKLSNYLEAFHQHKMEERKKKLNYIDSEVKKAIVEFDSLKHKYRAIETVDVIKLLERLREHLGELLKEKANGN